MTVVGLRMSKILPLACQWQVVIHSPTYFRNYGILRIPEIIVNSSTSEKYSIDDNGQNLKVQNMFLLYLKWSKKWSKARKLFLQWFSWNHRSTSNLYCGKKRNFFFTDVATWRFAKILGSFGSVPEVWSLDREEVAKIVQVSTMWLAEVLVWLEPRIDRIHVSRIDVSVLLRITIDKNFTKSNR